jgi:hypothetical protein
LYGGFRQPGYGNEGKTKAIRAHTKYDQQTGISIAEALREWTPLLRPNYQKSKR